MGTVKLMHLENLESATRTKGDENTKQVLIDHVNQTVELRYAVGRDEYFHEPISNRTRFEREKHALSKLKHRYLVKMLRYEDDPRTFARIFLEYVSPVSLKQVIRSPRYSYTANTILTLWKQLLSAANYLDLNHFVHRDIKPENIMLNKFGDMKLIDFEMSKYLYESASHSYDTGTKAYVPPEAMPNKGIASIFNHKGDVYSIGVTMWEMVARRAIMGHILKNIEDWRLIEERQAVIPHLSCDEAFVQIIGMCTAFSIEERGTARQAMDKVEDVIMSGVYSRYEKVPSFDPTRVCSNYPERPDGLNARWLGDEPSPTNPVPSSRPNRAGGDVFAVDLPFDGNLDAVPRPVEVHHFPPIVNRVMLPRMNAGALQDFPDTEPSFLEELIWDDIWGGFEASAFIGTSIRSLTDSTDTMYFGEAVENPHEAGRLSPPAVSLDSVSMNTLAFKFLTCDYDYMKPEKKGFFWLLCCCHKPKS